RIDSDCIFVQSSKLPWQPPLRRMVRHTVYRHGQRQRGTFERRRTVTTFGGLTRIADAVTILLLTHRGMRWLTFTFPRRRSRRSRGPSDRGEDDHHHPVWPSGAARTRRR